MQLKCKVLLLTLLASTLSHADVSDPESAYRDESIPYEFYESRAGAQAEASEDLYLKGLRSTPLNTATPYTPDIVLPKATVWKSHEALNERFERIRDERFISLKSQSNFPRRLSWLYPFDGCYARAALANRNFFRWLHPLPSKVFAFGHLKVKTTNSPRGYVSWWYHVAPIVQVEGEKYVIDPSIEPSRPLPLGEWLAKMGNPSKMKVAICNSGTYSPNDNCLKESDGLEVRAEKAIQHFLKLEWNNVRKLGQNPEVILGERPPWIP